MVENNHRATYRINNYRKREDQHKKYYRTYEVLDHHTECLLATSDVMKNPLFTMQSIFDDKKRAWQMKPNRKIMPSRWMITDPNENVVAQIDQLISRKLLNPLSRVMFTIKNADGNEQLRIVDHKSNLIDQVMGCSPGEFALLRNRTLAAKMLSIPRKKVKEKGIRGWVKGFMAGSDRCIESAGKEYPFPAPVALGLYVIYDDLSSRSTE